MSVLRHSPLRLCHSVRRSRSQFRFSSRCQVLVLSAGPRTPACKRWCACVPHPPLPQPSKGRNVSRCVTACGGVGRSCSSSSRLGVGVGQHLVGCLLPPRAFAPGEPRASPGGVARAPGAPWPGARRTAAPPPPAPAPGAPSEASGDPCRVTSGSSPPAAGDPAGRRLPGAGLPAHPGGPGLPEPPGTPLCQRWGHPLFPRSRARRGTAGRFGVAWRGADDDDGAGGKLWLQG